MIEKILLILFILSSFLNTAYCQEDDRIDLVCEFEDFYDFESFAYVDTLLYVANRYGLFVYSYNENNMEEPPVELVRYRTRGETEALLIVDSLCYLADGYAGLRIIDISDIYNIQEIGYCEEASGGQFMQLQDDILYMACGRNRFRSVDVSDPTDPVLLQTFNRGSDDFRIVDNLIYSGCSIHTYMEVFDITDPSDIQIAGQYDFGERGSPKGLEIHDDYLYYVTDRKFRIISIEDPDNLEVLYEDDHRSWNVGANTVRYFGDHLLYMHSTHIWNVEDPYEPEILFGTDYVERFSDWSEVSETASFSCCRTGFYIYNIEDLRNVEEIHWLPSACGLSDVYVQEDIMYVTSKYKYGSKFDIYNIEDINNPVKIGEIDSTEGAGPFTYGFDGIFVQDDLAVLWAWDGRHAILIYSVADAEQPRILSEMDAVYPRDIIVDGDYIYASCEMGGGFKVISFEDPEHPEVVWEFLPPLEYQFRFFGVDVAGDYAYTISNPGRSDGWERNFHVWNKSDPENLELIGRCEAEGFEGKVVVNGDYAYVTAFRGGGLLSVISIEDPENPELVNTIELPQYPTDCAVKYGLLFLTFDKMGFYIFNLEDPSEPELVTWYDTAYSTGGFAYYNQLHVEDSYVFLPGMIYDVSRITGRWNVELSAEFHNFGEVQLNTDSTFQLTISNLAQQSVEILDILTDSLAFTVDFDSVLTIDPNEEASLNVTFTPTEQRNYNGMLTIHTERRDLTVDLFGTGVDLSVADEDMLPLEFGLYPAYPNPFNSTTTIRYGLDKSAPTRLALYDLSGREVVCLVNEKQSAGRYQITWDAEGRPSGMYLLRLKTEDRERVTKLILIR
ncbi:T9SS type A sorting domain-containing protein [bacterium]|nr:T9SS type A sorting domain-containing protein [bacterium]